MKEAETEESEGPLLLAGGMRIRFEVLLGAFALYFVYTAVASSLGIDTGGLTARLLSSGMLVALLSASALAVSARRVIRYGVLANLLAAIVLLVVSRIQGKTNAYEIVAHVLMAAFVASVSTLITRSVWKLKQADTQAIAAALCAFLMLGLFWSLLYSLIGHLDSTAFGPHDLRLGETEPHAPFYFSFVTLTTLGYGDISPVSPPARIFAILEAIVGQVFLVVLVARLVGMSIAAPAGSDGNPSDPS